MMITQENRLLKIGTSLGDDVLLLTEFRGVEGISIPFEFELELISEIDHSIEFKDIIGKNVTVSIGSGEEDTDTRYFNGIISSFAQQGGGDSEETLNISKYSATLVPSFWLLKMNSNIKIFQKKTVPVIVDEILKERECVEFEDCLSGSYPELEYCVQYRESDFNFISRLLEQYGIYYFFTHENGHHKLILADNPSCHDPLPSLGDARMAPAGSQGFNEQETHINSLDFSKEIRPAKYSLDDYNFKKPKANLAATTDGDEKFELSPLKLEIYDSPGEYVESDDGKNLATVRMEEEEVQVVNLSGIGTIYGFTPGYKFKLLDYFREDLDKKHYTLTSISHSITQSLGAASSSSSNTNAEYSNAFNCIPVETPFRPQRKTPKPIVEGVQTAIVVGAKGEEIDTDEFGRVKVKFHWDRDEKADESSSCWIRVSQLFAGNGWGAMFIPRIGQEVIVDYIEGDPDRPIITGRVYHGLNNPPYKLPNEKTKSTIKTNSSKDGGGFNEIRFEDLKGEEQLFFHAERDQDIRVENDRKEFVGNERHLTVEADHFEKILTNKHKSVGGDQIESIDGNDDHAITGDLTVGISGDKNLDVSGDVKCEFGGDYSRKVGGDDKKKVSGGLSIDAGKDIMQKAGAKFAVESGADLHIKAGTNLVLEAGMQISLKAGGNIIDIGTAGITVKGANVYLDGSAMVSVKGGVVNINTGGGGGSAASGCGCSPKAPVAPDGPEEPTEPTLPCEAAAGSVEEVETPAEMLANAAGIPQVEVFKGASKSGAPHCEA